MKSHAYIIRNDHISLYCDASVWVFEATVTLFRKRYCFMVNDIVFDQSRNVWKRKLFSFFVVNLRDQL